MRTWNHFPKVVKTDAKELKVKKEKKGWAGWIPKSDEERQKFQESALCPTGSRGWVDDGHEGGLEVSQERLEGAAAVVKATTMATRNKNKFKVPAEIRQVVTEVARCRNLVVNKVLRKKGI